MKDELKQIRPGVWRLKTENGIEYTRFDTRQIIRDRRKSLRMTLEQLAEKTGTTAATLSRIESGIVEKLDSDKLFKIADALQCSPQYLTGEIDTLFPENMEDDFANQLYAAYMAADDKTKTIVRTLLDL